MLYQNYVICSINFPLSYKKMEIFIEPSQKYIYEKNIEGWEIL